VLKQTRGKDEDFTARDGPMPSKGRRLKGKGGKCMYNWGIPAKNAFVCTYMEEKKTIGVKGGKKDPAKYIGRKWTTRGMTPSAGSMETWNKSRKG